jgi:rifampicin phosphotransferase
MSTPDMTDSSTLPIPTPGNFPVEWARPEDARLFWMHERMHFPEPVTPLTDAVWALVLSGFTRAAAAYDMGLRFEGRRINSYHYEAINAIEAAPEELEAQRNRSEEKLEAAMANLSEAWATEWLPEIKRHLQFWETFDLPGATPSELLGHLAETIARIERLFEVHDLVMDPVLVSISMFDDLYHDLFGDDHAFDAYRLLQGFDSKTLASDRALWQLSRAAKHSPEVHNVLVEQPAGDVVATLERSADGRDFLAALRAYLEEYGQRNDRLELSCPRWIENPTPAITNLKDYIGQPDRDPSIELAALAAEREQLIAQTRARLSGYPQPVVSRFEFLLKAAHEATVLTEDHGFWIDLRSLYRVRLVMLEFGRRFAEAGVLDAQDDVFYLTLDELRQTIQALPRLDRRMLVIGRRAEQEYFRTIQPPAALGTMPDDPPPADAVGRALEKFFGGPPTPPAEANVVAGHAGAPGVVRGPARVVRSLADAGRLQPGDILVTETTSTPWTPLFATVAAVVTDTGGILSHCAVVAREYRIPAVVGAELATATIRDGQIVEVDGTRGLVRLDI